MDPDIVAIWAKSKGQGHLCTLDTSSFKLFFIENVHILCELSAKQLIYMKCQLIFYEKKKK